MRLAMIEHLVSIIVPYGAPCGADAIPIARGYLGGEAHYKDHQYHLSRAKNTMDDFWIIDTTWAKIYILQLP